MREVAAPRPSLPPPELWFLQTQHLPSFQSLSHCELITDDGILHLSNSPCGHERLRVLELDNCLLITDVALEHLEHCRGLERLELYDCQQVTRAGIKRMRVSGAAASPGRAAQATAGANSLRVLRSAWGRVTPATSLDFSILEWVAISFSRGSSQPRD